MKKKFLIIGVLVIFSLSFWGCEDLDTFPEGGTQTSEQKEDVYTLDPEKLDAATSGIFSQFSLVFSNSDGNHNDIGYPTQMLQTDMNGHHMITEVTGYNWFQVGLTYSDRNASSWATYYNWANMYKIIFAANNVLVTIDEDDEPKFNFSRAQGHAARAFAYHTLAQLYAANYVGHENDNCVPIITHENSDQVALDGGAPRATVQEVYDFILDDLTIAIDNLEDNPTARADKRFIDLATAYGLRARVYLAMHKYPEAAQDAQSAIDVSEAVPASIDEVNGPTFWSSNETNWMWGIIVDENHDYVRTGIVNWISHIGSFSGNGYNTVNNGYQISKKIYNTIPETDIRKGWWLNADTLSPNLTAEEQEYVKDIVKYRPYTQVKFAAYERVVGQTTLANDIPLMRIEEMYLIKAEAEEKSGGSGISTLTGFIQAYRDPQYSYPGASIDEEIFRQRIIELWGEGLSWYDYQRLGITVDRRGAGYHNASIIFVIEPNDPVRLWRVPLSEIESNLFISDADNNPHAPAPTPVPDID